MYLLLKYNHLQLYHLPHHLQLIHLPPYHFVYHHSSSLLPLYPYSHQRLHLMYQVINLQSILHQLHHLNLLMRQLLYHHHSHHHNHHQFYTQNVDYDEKEYDLVSAIRTGSSSSAVVRVGDNYIIFFHVYSLLLSKTFFLYS